MESSNLKTSCHLDDRFRDAREIDLVVIREDLNDQPRRLKTYHFRMDQNLIFVANTKCENAKLRIALTLMLSINMVPPATLGVRTPPSNGSLPQEQNRGIHRCVECQKLCKKATTKTSKKYIADTHEG